jgi:hypothetical protein
MTISTAPTSKPRVGDSKPNAINSSALHSGVAYGITSCFPLRRLSTKQFKCGRVVLIYEPTLR